MVQRGCDRGGRCGADVASTRKGDEAFPSLVQKARREVERRRQKTFQKWRNLYNRGFPPRRNDADGRLNSHTARGTERERGERERGEREREREREEARGRAGEEEEEEEDTHTRTHTRREITRHFTSGGKSVFAGAWWLRQRDPTPTLTRRTPGTPYRSPCTDTGHVKPITLRP